MEPHCYQPLVGKKTSLEDSAEPIASSQGGTGTPACLQYPTESSTDQDQDCSLQRRARPAVCRDTLLSPGAPGTVCCTLTDGPGYFTQHQQMNTRASQENWSHVSKFSWCQAMTLKPFLLLAAGPGPCCSWAFRADAQSSQLLSRSRHPPGRAALLQTCPWWLPSGKSKGFTLGAAFPRHTRSPSSETTGVSCFLGG